MSTQSYEPAQTTESVSTAAGGGEPTSAAHRWAGSRRAWSIGLLASVGLVAVIAAVWIVLNGGSSAVPAEISVAKIINRVETDRPRETGPARERFVPAEIGQALLPGDGVRTYVNSEVRIDIQIQEYTRVTRTKPNTLWRLGRFSLEEETIIELDEGKVFLFDNAANPIGRPFKIVTPAGTASPRGTWMSFSYDPVSNVAELRCFRGSCELANEFGSQLLRDEQKSSTTKLAAPAAPVDMTPDETQEFADLPEVATGEVVIPAPKPTPKPTPEPTIEPTTPGSTPDLRIGNPAGAQGGGEASSGDELDDPKPELEETAVPQPTREPTRVAAPTATPRPTPKPTIRKTLEPTPTATTRPTLTPTPKPLNILLPPVNSQTIPHVFVGTATINSAVAPDGTEVSVWTSGYSEPLAKGAVSAGAFTLLIPQYGTESFDGRDLLFKLEGLAAMPVAVWSPGGADVISLEAGLN